MENNTALTSKAYVSKNGSYLSTTDQLDSDTLRAFVNDNQSRSNKYQKNYQLYSGAHEILKAPFDPK